MENIHLVRIVRKAVIYIGIVAACMLLMPLSGCGSKAKPEPPVSINRQDRKDAVSYTQAPTREPVPSDADSKPVSTLTTTILDENGTTMETRIHAPAGYSRIPSSPEELTGFLRELPLKKAGSKIMLYDGSEKGYQEGHAAVFDLDIGKKDLQQCADSIIRIYAEYYWSIGAYDKIAFQLTNGFLMNYTKWRDGYRIVVAGNDVRWKKSRDYDNSYEEFRNYLEKVFIYAGTLSLSRECEPVDMEEILPGDMFLYGGSPGHCVLIVDIAEDRNGNRCYLLAQGYMPAQDFHILKNPLHTEDPWYYASELSYPLRTPEWTFEEGSAVRWGDFSLDKQ